MSARLTPPQPGPAEEEHHVGQQFVVVAPGVHPSAQARCLSILLLRPPAEASPEGAKLTVDLSA